MGTTDYSRVYGFRTHKLPELVHAFAARTGISFEERETGAYNGAYYSGYDANECEILAYRHLERENGEGMFHPEWHDFGVIMTFVGDQPIEYDDAIASLGTFAPTLLSVFRYNRSERRQEEHRAWNPRTERLEAVAPWEKK